jgi:hypothetical protein
MKNVVISQNKHWNTPYTNLYERDIFSETSFF